MPKPRIKIPKKKIDAFCRQYHVQRMAIFGSALRDDFGPDSDIDVLVTFAPGSLISLWELGQIRAELTELFGRPVDLVEKAGLRNPYRRKSILESAQVIYAS